MDRTTTILYNLLKYLQKEGTCFIYIPPSYVMVLIATKSAQTYRYIFLGHFPINVWCTCSNRKWKRFYSTFFPPLLGH